MSTINQIRANQANAQNSTGPSTPEGKAKVSQNRRTHGLTGGHVILPTESTDDYAALLDLGPFEDARVALKELYLFARESAPTSAA